MTRGLGEHWEVINILTMMMVSGAYRWAKTYQIIHIKYVQFAIVFQSYHNNIFWKRVVKKPQKTMRVLYAFQIIHLRYLW